MSDLDPTVLANYLFPVLVLFTGLVAYVFFIRPLLRKTPGFREVYDVADGFWHAVDLKLGNVKQKLTTVLLSAGSFILLAHDQLAPIVTQAGVDPSLILPKVPAWAWPIITMGILALLQWLRSRADRQARANAEALLNAGLPLVAPAPGLPITTLPSPSPLANLPDKKDI